MNSALVFVKREAGRIASRPRNQPKTCVTSVVGNSSLSLTKVLVAVLLVKRAKKDLRAKPSFQIFSRNSNVYADGSFVSQAKDPEG